MISAPYLKAILAKFKEEREKREIPAATIEEKLILGPGWIDRFESGDTVPTLDMLLAMLHCIGISLAEFIKDLEVGEAPSEIDRHIFAVPDGMDLDIHFRYADHDAVYRLGRATNSEFEAVIKVLRDGLARLVASDAEGGEQLKTDAVAKCFLKAVKIWPYANPSDLWWFIVNRAYCDPFNHPAPYARMSFEQSWKRTGGWALEEVLVRHYGPILKANNINIVIGTTQEKREYLRSAKGVTDRLEPDKADVLLLGQHKNKLHFFGVVHVRRALRNDGPMTCR